MIPVETVWASSWQEAVVEAADLVTAVVLPRTGFSNRAPWSGWRGYTMPPGLVHHFERAEELTSERRYDEALDRYFSALELDPKSVDLRLRKGYVQEKLGLFLDAVATYAAARKMADSTSRALYGRRARRNRRASGRIASYRLAVLLAGVDVAHQWRKPDGAVASIVQSNTIAGDRPRHEQPQAATRDQQRVRLRECLRPELIEMLAAHNLIIERRSASAGAKGWLSRAALGRPPIAPDADASGPPPWNGVSINALLKDFAAHGLEGDDDDARYYPLRNVLAHLARKELARVRRQATGPPRTREPIEPLTVKLTMAAVDLRLGWIKHKLAGATDWDPKVDERLKRTTIRSRVGLAEAPLRTWAQYYNAACLYALPLLVTGTRDRRRQQQLAEQAVWYLARAVCSTTSQYVGQRRDWVLSEDPDLKGLRHRREFRHFEVINFPSAAGPPWRPTDLRRAEQSRYGNELLSQTARRWEAVWHARRDKLLRSMDTHVTLDWFADEEKAWALIKAATRAYRHWPVRYDLIEQMRRCGVRYEFEPLAVPVPCFTPSQAMIDAGIHQHMVDDMSKLDGMIEDEIARNGSRLVDIDLSVPAIDGRLRPCPPVQQLQIELRDRDFWHRQTPRLYLACVCDVHAAMWQRLGEWLGAAPDDEPAAKAAFMRAIKEEQRLKSTASGIWMLWVLERRLVPIGWHDINSPSLSAVVSWPRRFLRRNGSQAEQALGGDGSPARQALGRNGSSVRVTLPVATIGDSPTR